MTGKQSIFRLAVPEGYEWALPSDPADFEVFRTLPERGPGESWTPFRMELLKTDDRGRRKRRADMPWLGRNVLILRDQAIEVIGAILQPHGTLLPLLCDEARLAVFSAPLIANALDAEHSEMKRIPSSGRIMKLTRPVFRTAAIADTMAFKLQEMPRGDLYLAEPLVQAILDTGMTAGTTFVPVEKVQDGGRPLGN